MARRFITPCLWFDDRAEEAAAFYVKTFPEGRITGTSRYPAEGPNPSGRPPGSVLTVAFEIAGQAFTALNGGPMFVINPSISFFVHVETADEARRLFEALAEGGETLMPLGAYPWSEQYGWVQDRFGVSWQVLAGPRAPGAAMLVPCLMFTGEKCGRAEEAIEAYTRTFPEGRVESLVRAPAEGDAKGTVQLARLVVGGQELALMDSPGEHPFTFNEALSLQVMCADQAAVDRYWAALPEGGAPGPCGWVKDRFGVSWQVVPESMDRWMTCEDAAARDRAFRAMLGMTKLDIATLEAALAGA